MLFGSRLNRLATSIRRALSEYGVLGKSPPFVSDFINNKYLTGGNSSTFASAITHARSTNAVMTDGYGPELVTNGGFDSDSDWSISPSGSAEISNSVLFVDGVTSTVTQNNLGTEDNKMYVVEFDYTFQGAATTGTRAYIRLGEVSGQKGLNGAHPNQTKRISLLMQAGSGNYLALVPTASSGESITIDNISVREMPVLKWAPHNLLSYSEDFSQWTLQPNVTLTANQTDPFGGSNATLYNISASTGRAVDRSITFKNATYTFAVWVKAIVDTDVKIRRQSGSEVVTSITVAEGWQLIEADFDMSAGTGNIGFFDSSGSTGDRFYVYGAHFYRSDLGGMVDNPDRGDSYVPTTSSAKHLPRIGHHVYNGSAWVNEGLLAESELRVNLVTSTIPTNSVFGRAGTEPLVLNSEVSPAGLEDAAIVKESATTSTHYIYTYSTPFTSGTTYTASVYVKADTATVVQLTFSSGIFGSTVYANFDLTNGTIGSKGSTNVAETIQEVGNGWYRISLTATATTANSSATGLVLGFADNNASANRLETYAGDTAQQFYVYGAQLEVGDNNASAPTPSSLIPTSGQQGERAAETFTIPSANLPWPSPNYIGSELVDNGDFADTSDWTKSNATISGEVLSLDGTGGVNSYAYQDGKGIVAGKLYEYSFDILSVSAAGGGVRVRVGNVGYGQSVSSVGSHSGVIVAAGTDRIQVEGISGFIGTVDNVSVREIDPLSVSIAMDGRMTYADTDTSSEAFFFRWQKGSSNYIRYKLDTSGTRQGEIDFLQRESTSGLDLVSTANAYLRPDILVPYNIAGRHGSTFINGATDGIALTAGTAPTALADLSATDLDLAQDYMGTIGTFRVWDKDLGDTGIVEATNPSLEPSLSLTFEGTSTNSFVIQDWAE